ncbi:MAG TPA: hypothetical protein VG101_11610 [Puia sp.]|nr:hypothetical protein [Puia sp.]
MIQVSFYLAVASVNPKIPAGDRSEPGYMVGYYIGVNLFLIPTILCGIGVYRVRRKIKMKEREDQELLLSFDDPS